METLYIDAHAYTSPFELHQALKTLLCLPDYYGHNADALNDCLGERKPVRLLMAHIGDDPVSKELLLCGQVVRDHDGDAIVCTDL